MSNRVSKGVQAGSKSSGHFEAELPQHPQYLIEVDVDKIVDLSPPHLRKK